MTRSRAPSPAAIKLLAELLERAGNWSYGYELGKSAMIKSGTLYPLLIRLEERGYLEAEWQPPVEPGRPPRHAYRLTAEGVAAARSAIPDAAPRNRTGMREART